MRKVSKRATSQQDRLFGVKRWLLKSQIGRSARELQALVHLQRIQYSSRVLEQNHILCISPYKTGTTFLASCYSNTIASHEPLRYATLRYVNNCKNDLFYRRLRFLGLNLECSGHFSAHAKDLRCDLPPQIKCCCIGRLPSEWVTSVINYWKILHVEGLRYRDYIDSLFWLPIIGESLYEFFCQNDIKKETIVTRLERFYLSYIENAIEIPGMLFIPIEQLVDRLPEIDDLVGASSKPVNAWRRTNKDSYFRYENESCDKHYLRLVEQR